MSKFETLSGVRVTMTASHTEPFGAQLHEHSWEIWASFTGRLVDGRKRQAELAKLLEPMKGRDMNVTLGAEATNEGLARFVLRGLGADCVAVEVIRHEEGLRAKVWRRGALG